MRKVIAIIPARMGSKRLPNKNKKFLHKKPLIAWTIEQALQCGFINEIVISSNDQDIITIGQKYEINDFRIRVSRRPEELSLDDSSTSDVILYELDFEVYDDLTTVILLQPTSPLRSLYDINMAYQIFKERVSCPVFSAVKEDSCHFKLNGALYIFTLGSLRLTKNIHAGEFNCIYFMPKERSVDIDTIEDFKEAEKLMKEVKEKK